MERKNNTVVGKVAFVIRTPKRIEGHTDNRLTNIPCAENNKGKINQIRKPPYNRMANGPKDNPANVISEIRQLAGILTIKNTPIQISANRKT
jgi:hypothetical protein